MCKCWKLKDIILPDSLKRIIARQAEAEREKRAVIIASEGEVESAGNLAKAAATLASARVRFIFVRSRQSMIFPQVRQIQPFGWCRLKF